MSPVKFFPVFLVACAVGWVIFSFASRLLAFSLSKVMRASVGFRVAGWNCLRDVNIKFKKGAIESVSVGEIKLSLRRSLVNLGFSFISRDPKLQLLICDFEVVLRGPARSDKKNRSQRSRSAGRGKWMMLTYIARFLSVTVTELVVKDTKAVIEVRDLIVDISKHGGSNPILNVKLQIIPLLIQICDPHLSLDQSCSYSQIDSLLLEQPFSAPLDKTFAPFHCDDLSIVCEVGHDREAGIRIRNLDVTSGVLTINLNEELLRNTDKRSETLVGADVSSGTSSSISAEENSEKKNSLQALKKQILIFPEKVSFNMPKLDVKFMHGGQDLLVENNVTGLYLSSSRSQSFEDSGGATTHFDIQMDFSEIHLFRDGNTSVMEIKKVAFLASVDVPMEPPLPIRAEVDVKLGGTQCNIIPSRLKPWLHLHMAKKKKVVLHKDISHQEKLHASRREAIMWTCTASAPEMTMVLYNLNDLPLYHVCSQSSHLFAHNIASRGVQVHAELGELHLHMADEYQECLKENLFGVETNSGSLIHIARVSLDKGHKEIDSNEANESRKWYSEFTIDISGMGVHFGFQHVETLLFNIMSFKVFLKGLPSSKKATDKKLGRSSKKASKGTNIIQVNLEKCSVNFIGDLDIEDTVVADPKRVNFGSQGGQVIINNSADGTPRTANITSTLPGDRKNLTFSTCLEILRFKLCIDKQKDSTRVDIERVRSMYEECIEEHKHGTKVTLFDMQNAKFVRRSGGLSEVAVCSLFNATNIAVRWEPDPHLALFEVITRMKFLLFNKNARVSESVKEDAHFLGNMELEKVADAEHQQPEKQYRRKQSVFAIDIENLKVSAELADGVEVMIFVQSIFSENAQIGVLLENLMLSFNDNRVLKSSRMQISRIPVKTSSNLDARGQLVTMWDWVVQGVDFHICMPFRLQLRAIDDAVEDTLRALKLVAAAKTCILSPVKKDSANKVKTKSTKFGSIRFRIGKLTADIEEEPIQGWLDEHYRLMKNEVCELDVRLKFLEDTIKACTGSLGSADLNELALEKKLIHDGMEINVHDLSAIQKLREEIHQQIFLSYYQACQKLVLSEGSGACRKGFQSGFKPSRNRSSLLSICATELDVTLNKIEGGDSGMIEFVRKVDPVALENEIPFSRFYGRDLTLQTGSLSVQIRDYTFPLFSATDGKCQGRIVLAQQATCFQPQMLQDVFVGRWRRVRMLRSASGTTPAMKFYSDLPIGFRKAEVSFGVGYEPAFADISYAFTIALRRASLGTRNSVVGAINPFENQPPKKEKSLPWWDDMRYYIHGNIGLSFTETIWNLLATTNPYEKLDKLKIVSGGMDIRQSDGRVSLSAKDFKVYTSSLESLLKNCSLKPPNRVSRPFLDTPAFAVEVTMDWECESGNPLNHYLHALPAEGEPRTKVYDPFRSTSLSLRFNFSLRPYLPPQRKVSSGNPANNILAGPIIGSSQKVDNILADSPTIHFGAHDLAWLFKWWNLNYNPPHKLRSFSRWPRFGIPRAVRSGNLSLDKVMTECFLRIDSTPSCLRHVPIGDDDPASGLTFEMTKLKYELCYSRGKQRYTFDCKREPLDLVYQGLDLHMLKVYLNRDRTSVVQDVQSVKRPSQNGPVDKVNNDKGNSMSACAEKHRDDGFLLYSDYFTIRKQAPKADPARLLAWQEAGRKNLEMTYVRSEFENGSESDHTRSDPSDDDGFNVVIADNCQRIFVYGLKLLWTIENRDAVWSWVHGISKAFEPPKPSPSRQYAQRKLIEGQQPLAGSETLLEENSKSPTITSHGQRSPSSQYVDNSGLLNSTSPTKIESYNNINGKQGSIDDSEEDGTRHFMVNVIQPQFNLHSEDANGRFLLAAASGRVLARSFHSVLHVGYEMIEQALGAGNVHFPELEPEMTWKRVELSVMLEHVQAHVAPTDVDPGAGLQWLPKILRSSPKVKRTGALLERVFMPCQMYFRYTRHKGGTPELKVKPLKDLTFNSPNITATMTSRQFQVMLDVLTNLLFARLPKPRRSSLTYPSQDDDDIEEEADEVVPDGVEEVELAKVNLEKRERERKLLLDDIRTLSVSSDATNEQNLSLENDVSLWMITGGTTVLVKGLIKELGKVNKCRKAASSALRTALQKAAQLRLMEKEKNKSPSYAMRISMRINKVVWSMLADGKAFAEAEINDMIYDFDRDYKDIGIAQFTTKSFVVRNCLPNAKSDMLLSAWNAPPEWGKNFMLRVDSKQGAPKDGTSPLELFQVEIYPLKIHLTETMYRMMWEYFFPEEEQDSQRRQLVWKVSTTAGTKRARKSISGSEAAVAASSSNSAKEPDAHGKSLTTAAFLNDGISQASGDSAQGSKLQIEKANPELRRTSSFDRTWEENVAESVANELVLSSISTKSGPLSTLENQHAVIEEASKSKLKESKVIRAGRLSHEEKKVGKSQDEKRARARKMMEFHNIKISQVELQVTYEGSRFAVNELRLLMDTFHRVDFTGTWRRLFSRVKKHIIWGVLKSVTGMQGKKFKDKALSQREARGGGVPDSDLNLSDSDGGLPGKSDQFPVSWLKRPNDGAGDGFVTSIRGLFNSQRRRARAFVLRTMRGEQDNEFHSEWSESDVEFSPFARQLTITKAKKLIRRHTKKFRSRGHKSSGLTVQRESLPSSPRETTPYQSDSSGPSSYEDFQE